MTKKEENQQSSNINFKLKLIKIKDPVPRRNMGIYEQMRNGNRVEYSDKLDTKQLREVMEELFYGKTKI